MHTGIPPTSRLRKFLGFKMGRKTWQFAATSYGLSLTLVVFTWTVEIIFSSLCSIRKLNILAYLVDSLSCTHQRMNVKLKTKYSCPSRRSFFWCLVSYTSTEVRMSRPFMGHVPVSSWPAHRENFLFLWRPASSVISNEPQDDVLKG